MPFDKVPKQCYSDLMERVCEICNKSFNVKRRTQKYCSQECALGAERQKYKAVGRRLPTATVGTLSELQVCMDLLWKGHEVFRAVSPACSCDLAILRHNKLLRIEVTTGHYMSGRLQYGPHKLENYDILAVVPPDDSDIVYLGDFD